MGIITITSEHGTLTSQSLVRLPPPQQPLIAGVFHCQVSGILTDLTLEESMRTRQCTFQLYTLHYIHPVLAIP